ncbi:hypothetical protein OTU49_002923 [Cherax quadricarinatus]|uniref:Uncharacterized protein n=1 Tax=Cherax quadricarinatus TaxID=27406 RepID=A0AAW0XL41_CHEQU
MWLSPPSTILQHPPSPQGEGKTSFKPPHENTAFSTRPSRPHESADNTPTRCSPSLCIRDTTSRHTEDPFRVWHSESPRHTCLRLLESFIVLMHEEQELSLLPKPLIVLYSKHTQIHVILLFSSLHQCYCNTQLLRCSREYIVSFVFLDLPKDQSIVVSLISLLISQEETR